MISRVLPVPYYTQPTAITCQSTCLKMFGKYLERKQLISSAGANKWIEDIWKEINTGSERRVQARNAYANMVWWLEKYFSPIMFRVEETTDTAKAMQIIRKKIDAGFPLLVSTNHDRTSGHIILVCGYQIDLTSDTNNVSLVCHDPYGKFNPQLQSVQFGGRRWEDGSSLMSGGENGPGKSVIYDSQGIRRIRQDKHSTGKFFLISATT